MTHGFTKGVSVELLLLLLINLLVSETCREIVTFFQPCFCKTNREQWSQKYFVSESQVICSNLPKTVQYLPNTKATLQNRP